jgi:hypothetical protein
LTANNVQDTYFLYDTKDSEGDDYMHNPSPHDATKERRSCSWSWRGLLNILGLLAITLTLVAMFAVYPVIQQVLKLTGGVNGWGLGGTNSSGQVPGEPDYALQFHDSWLRSAVPRYTRFTYTHRLAYAGLCIHKDRV